MYGAMKKIKFREPSPSLLLEHSLGNTNCPMWNRLGRNWKRCSAEKENIWNQLWLLLLRQA